MLLSYLSFSQVLISQINLDSANYYENLAQSIVKQNPDSAEYYINKTASFYQEEDDYFLAYYHTFLGVVKRQQGLLDDALKHYDTAILYQKKIDHTEGIAGNYNNIGHVYELKGDYKQAITYLQKAKLIFKEKKMSQQYSIVLQNIAEIYLSLSKVEEAKEELAYAEEYFKSAHDTLGLGFIYASKSDITLQLGDTSLALQYIIDAQYFFGLANSLPNKAAYGVQHCQLLFLMDSLVQQQTLLDEYLKIAIEFDLKVEKARLLSILAKVKNLQNKKMEALSLLHKSTILLETIGSDKYLMDNYLLTAEIYEQLEDNDSALAYYKSYLDTYKKVEGVELKKEVQALIIENNILEKESEIREANIQLLEKENKIQQINSLNEKNRLIKNAIIVLVIIISLVAIYLYYRYRKNKIFSRQLAQTIRERDFYLNEVHHRVKNNLQMMYSFLDLQVTNGTNTNTDEALVRSRDRIFSMSAVHELLYSSGRLSELNIKEYLEQLITYFVNNYEISSRNIQIESYLDDLILSHDTVIIIGQILNETITNSLKHAFIGKSEGKIKISLKNQGENFVLDYSDDGIGNQDFATINQSKSLGIKLIKGFTRQLGGTLEIKGDKGLMLLFTIPNPDNP